MSFVSLGSVAGVYYLRPEKFLPALSIFIIRFCQIRHGFAVGNTGEELYDL